MRRAALLLLLATASEPAFARETVDASAPQALAVTVYRDPNRGPDQAMDRSWPQGFAMISETRTVTLPPGESTIRFDGVAEGMVAVSAIVTGLPGGTIEKNRNVDLLSPAALVDGTLGNRVTITRTNPATGTESSESAVVRTRADGGLVLQTREGFEAVRCSGLPERLTFDRVPAGLSAKPVFTIDTRDPAGGTYTVTLTYLAWGFDWQAHYVATLEPGKGSKRELSLLSWLTLLNDNGQSFPEAELMAVAGTLNVESDFRALADPPKGKPLRLVCYPLGSTATGSPIDQLYPPPPSPPPPPMAAPIMVTGSRMRAEAVADKAAMIATEEALGDLKLYRVPLPVTVNAKGLKQVAFLQRDAVRGELVHVGHCDPNSLTDEARPLGLELHTVNDRKHGLGAALPMGGLTVFEPTARGELLLGEDTLRDHAEGEEVEIALTDRTQAFLTCEQVGSADPRESTGGWVRVRAAVTNAGSDAARVRLSLGPSGQWQLRGPARTRVNDGEVIVELTVPGNARRELTWDVRP